MLPRVKPIVLSEEQEQFFIETWENNSNDTARTIFHDELGLAVDVVWSISKKLREEGKIRDKRHKRYSEKESYAFKNEYERGRSLKEIAKAHNIGVKGVKNCLKEIYGGKLPIIQGKLEGEEWKDMEGFCRYQVSNLGRIYNKTLHRMVYGHDVNRYRYVELLVDSEKYRRLAVHRLVAQLYIPNPDNKPEVDHIDSAPQNNIVSNLRWVNKEEQIDNNETLKKRQLALQRRNKLWKIKPLLKNLLELEPDKLELVKMTIDYKS